ncbi:MULTISPECIES: GvpL/GvpF family gas vesicle protein [Halorussus]|uniref:GvpL/GvpF family gas vesicle protein n=1 Tax=Halorussus TaxID=1070314 RepID=UPI00209DEE29|nr:GvpL/GvpF family gas vesicle protein [Halorussus vallis]USZ76702.1 GvpL/GvpF family gas vesicle protein [Halorussus vallis]
MSGNKLYVYGVFEDDGDEEFELSVDGVGGADRVRAVSFRNLSALVSDIDTTDPEESDENAQAHDDVLRAALEHDREPTVVPMQFGMAFESARTLKNVLRGTRHSFTKALRDVEGTVELGVKVVSEEDADPDPEAVRAAADDHLGAVAVNDAENDRFSDRLLVNHAYLVERDRRDDFDEAVDALQSDLEDEAMVQYTGPWAPYNFVDIHVGANR